MRLRAVAMTGLAALSVAWALACGQGSAEEPRPADPTKRPPRFMPPPPSEHRLSVYDLRRTEQPLGEVRVGRLRFRFDELFVLNEAQRTALASIQERCAEEVAQEVEKALDKIKLVRSAHEKKLAELLPAPEGKALTDMWALSEEYNEGRKKIDADRRDATANAAGGMDAEKRRKMLDEIRDRMTKLDEGIEKKLQEAMTDEQRERLKPRLERKPPGPTTPMPPRPEPATITPGVERQPDGQPVQTPPPPDKDGIAPEDKGLKRGRTPKPGEAGQPSYGPEPPPKDGR